MADTHQWHYTDKTGQQCGPAPTDDLLKLIASKDVPMSAMAWKEGMANWMPISQIPELHTKPAPAPAPKTPAQEEPAKKTTAHPLSNTANTANTANTDNTPKAAVDPYETPESAKEFDDVPEIPLSYDEIHGIEHYEGIGRLSYIVLRPLLYLILFVPLILASIIFLGSEAVAWGALIVVTILLIRLHCLRFKNIGMSPWWTLALMVPLLNLPLYLMLHVCPAGYAKTKKLDLTGKVLGVFLIGIPIALILLPLDVQSTYSKAAEKAKETIEQQKQKQKKPQPPAQ